MATPARPISTDWKRKVGRHAPLFGVVFVVLILGTWLIVRSHAATPVTAVEAESGSLTTPATKVTDSTASGGTAVQFGSASTGGGGGGTTTQTNNCEPSPHLCGFPDSTNTGVTPGTTLTTVNGNVILSTAGQTYQNMLVNGSIIVTASNVIIKNVEVNVSSTSADPWLGIELAPGSTHDLIEDTTVHGADNNVSATQYAIWNAGDSGSTLVVDHVYLYYCNDCFSGGGTVKDSYLLANGAQADSHIEGTYDPGGFAFMDFEHNTIIAPPDAVHPGHPATAAIMASPDVGVVSNLTINNNLLAGGAYEIYGGSGGLSTQPAAVGTSVTNNRLSTAFFSTYGQFGPVGYCPASIVWTGNVDDNTGNALPLPPGACN